MARSSLISVTFVYASFSMSFSSNKDKVFISLGNDANMVNAQVSKPPGGPLSQKHDTMCDRRGEIMTLFLCPDLLLIDTLLLCLAL